MICFINLVDVGLAKIEFIFLFSPFIFSIDLFICFLLFKFQFLSTPLSSFFPSSSLLILYSENRYFPGSPPLKNILFEHCWTSSGFWYKNSSFLYLCPFGLFNWENQFTNYFHLLYVKNLNPHSDSFFDFQNYILIISPLYLICLTLKWFKATSLKILELNNYFQPFLFEGCD